MRAVRTPMTEWGETVAFEGKVASAAGVLNAAHGALVDVVVEALAGRLWEGWKLHSPVQWLMWRAGGDRTPAHKIVRVAKRASELPTVLSLLRAGELSLDQATTVARYTPTEYEASVCELAVNASVGQIVAATRQYAWDDDIVEREKKAPTGPTRSVSFGTDESDQWRWVGWVSARHGVGVVHTA